MSGHMAEPLASGLAVIFLSLRALKGLKTEVRIAPSPRSSLDKTPPPHHSHALYHPTTKIAVLMYHMESPLLTKNVNLHDFSLYYHASNFFF